MKNSTINSAPKGKKAGANGKFQKLQMHNMCPKSYQHQSMEVKSTGITKQQAEMINLT